VAWAALASVAAAQPATSAGVIDGRVLDESRNPLPGASVRIEGTNIQTATDRTGAFRLAGVPTGAQTLLVTYIGREEARQPVQVGAETTGRQEIQLGPARFAESVTVSAESERDAQARALNQQKTAPNITNVVSADQIGSFPDPNAAETTQRIPGLSIQRDQGEGRYVIVRGTEPRLNSMMIDGATITRTGSACAGTSPAAAWTASCATAPMSSA
jgi:hypothetical protein